MSVHDPVPNAERECDKGMIRRMNSRLFGLIPAAGAGQRLGATIPKQYLPLSGHCMLWHAVQALLCEPSIDSVFVVLSPEDGWFRQQDWSAFGERLAPLYCGGATRRDSVHNGLMAASSVIDEDDWVLVHDAARPCLTQTDLLRLIAQVGAQIGAQVGAQASDDASGGILALPVADTLKSASTSTSQADARRIMATPSRDGLWQAQTPQMFRAGLLGRALQQAASQGVVVTDEASAVEALGLQPLLVPGSSDNFKVTLPGDLALAEAVLQRRQLQSSALSAASALRVGQGFDVHVLCEGRPLIIGGVTIPHARGLLGHSDADVLLHALIDALLGAAALGDIGRHFPDTDARWQGADSRALLRQVLQLLQQGGFCIVNIDATIIAEQPKMAPHIPAMVANVAADLGLSSAQVNIKAKTFERIGALGRGEGIAVEAIALLQRSAA